MSNAIDPRLAWCCLSRIRGLGIQTLLKIFSVSGNIPLLFEYKERDLLDLGLAKNLIKQILDPPWKLAEQDAYWHNPLQQRYIIPYDDPAYPIYLREISAPPMLLFVNGEPAVLSNPQISIVGSRNPSVHGQETAHNFAVQLSKLGFTITSGLASGIDSAAHRGALANKGITIAVAATGLDKVYPRKHEYLAQHIVRQGALISEFTCGTPIRPEFFPRRNRIISGLSLGVLVIEAAERSGSLITAKFALEQGREVFAVPGSIYNPLAKGCHILIRQGAKLVESIKDILEEFPNLNFYSDKNDVKVVQDLFPGTLSEDERKVWQAIGFEPTMIDSLVERIAFPVAKLRSILMSLEVTKHIFSVPGGYQRAIQRASYE